MDLLRAIKFSSIMSSCMLEESGHVGLRKGVKVYFFPRNISERAVGTIKKVVE